MAATQTAEQVVRAEAKWVRLSARKARIVLANIRGRTVPEARTILAFTQRAAAIPKIDLTPPRALIGKSTVEAIRSGVIYGFAAQVDGMIARLRDELGDDIEAIATGGLAGAIVPFCEYIDDVDPLLTLKGLRLIWQRNQD